jgi:hypothetical protein
MIEDEVTVDLMQQAEALLNENKAQPQNAYSHLPAAVLAGAVLEHFLRTLCQRQSPPIPLNLENGNLKTLATLVNDLEKANLYNSVEKKQLKTWVDVRNHAAHGHFDKFEARQVAEMIEGIKAFIQRHTEPFPESATLHTD